jgi:hypothetical protein
MSHDMTQGFGRLEAAFGARLESVEKRLDALEQGGRVSLIGGANGAGTMATPSIPPANLGAGSMGPGGMANGGMANGGMTSGSILENRLTSVEARMNAMEQRQNGMEMPLDEVDARLMGASVI